MVSRKTTDRFGPRLRRGTQRLIRRIRGTTDIEALTRAGLRVGAQVYIGIGAFLDPDFCFLISIGDRATLSVNVTVLAHDASTRQFMGWTRLAPVHIGSDVFIGAGSVVLPGVTVGDGAVVAAGSIVRHDVPPGKMVAGNPARAIGEVGTYIARHQERIATTPHWPRAGWTASTGITPERIATMRAALQHGRDAYIK